MSIRHFSRGLWALGVVSRSCPSTCQGILTICYGLGQSNLISVIKVAIVKAIANCDVRLKNPDAGKT